MDHVAIMRKSWGLLPKILAGEKIIESRWCKNKAVPWGRINPGETVYFKNSGEKVSVKATVEKVLKFENLEPNKIKDILNKYGVGIGIKIEDAEKYFELFKDKKYCLLIYLNNACEIEPFEINKTGFGAMAAWMCVENIKKIKGKNYVPKSEI